MSVNLDRFVNAVVTRATGTVSRRGFSSILLAGFFDDPAWAVMKRVSEYSSSAAMRDEGFPATHPLVLAAERLESQSPRVRSWKVGRRAGAPVQKMRLAPAAPVEGEVFGFSVGGVAFEATGDAVPTIAEIVAALVKIVNPDDDAIITNIASAAAPQVLQGVALNGVLGGAELSPPRNVTLLLSNHADWDATVAVVAGLDKNGRVQTENLAIPNGGNTTVTGVKVFSKITSITIPAQAGAGGTAKLGVGKLFANGDLAVTASDHATYVEIVVDQDGDWWAYEDVSENLGLTDVTLEPAITLEVDLDAIKAADADFYGVVVADAQSAAQIEATAAWAELNTVLYAAHSADADVPENVNTDIGSSLAEQDYFRTFLFWSKRNHGRFPDAGILGATFPLWGKEPFDFEFKTIVGLLADDLGDDELTVLTGTPESPQSGKRVLAYVEALPTGTNRGTSITTGGLVAAGEWIENIIGTDFWRASMQASVFTMRINRPKVPFTQDGIDLFKGAIQSASEAVASPKYGILDPDSLTYDATPIEETTAEEREARWYSGVEVGARFTGAIRVFNVGATVTP